MDFEQALTLSKGERARMAEMQEALVARHGKERAKVLGQASIIIVQLRNLVPPAELFTSPAVQQHLHAERNEILARFASMILDQLGTMDAALPKAEWDKKQEAYGDEIALLVEATEGALVNVAKGLGADLKDVLENLKNGGNGFKPPGEGGPTLH